MTHVPLSPEFNEAVLLIQAVLIPQGFSVTDNGIIVDTFEKVRSIYDEEGIIVVWGGESENTIYADPHVNHAFRAWHDYVHITKGFPFSRFGERLTCVVQQQQIDLYVGYKFNKAARAHFKELLDIEINQQVDHYLRTGTYVTDQYNFAKERLQNEYK